MFEGLDEYQFDAFGYQLDAFDIFTLIFFIGGVLWMARGLYIFFKAVFFPHPTEKKRALVTAVLIFFAFVSVIWALGYLAELSEEQESHRDRLLFDTNTYLDSMCSIREACAAFPSIEQKCSIAGDIDRCISINSSELPIVPNAAMCSPENQYYLEPSLFQCFAH